MKKHLVLLAVLLQAASVSLVAQSKPKAGDIISGIVSDNDGPMMMVNVAERDSTNRIVAHCLTDIGGNFSFRLVNPDHRIEFSYVEYENVSVPIDTTYFEIKMKEWDGLSAIDITTDPFYEGLGLPVIPILKDAAWELMDPDSWYFGYLQKNAPEGYVCGYVVHDYDDNDIYSLFLVNNKNKYELVRKTIDYSESRTIKKKLARQLKKVTDKHLDDAEKNREDDFKQASDDGMRVPGFYEGNVIYVMNPGQIATFKPGYSTYLPDRIWNDELRKFSFHL